MSREVAPPTTTSPRNKVPLKTCRVMVGAASAVGLLAFAAGGWEVYSLRRKNPATTTMMRLRMREAASAGRPFGIRHRWVPIETVSPAMQEAIVLATDRRFHSHLGVNWGAIWRAWQANRKAGRKARGGSTITVQVAKNLYFHPRKSYLRKIGEVPIAYLMEILLGKKRILEIYLNIVEWGDGIFGVEAAAQHYFGKPASELTIEEASLLGAVLPNPRRWSPLKPTLFMSARAADIRRNMAR